MLKRRIALAGVVVVVAGLSAAPAWADNSGPPKPQGSGHSDNAFVCHGYPGAQVFVGQTGEVHGTPADIFCPEP